MQINIIRKVVKAMALLTWAVVWSSFDCHCACARRIHRRVNSGKAHPAHLDSDFNGISGLNGDGKVDLFNSAYYLSAVYWMMKAREARQSHNLYVSSSCFIGFAGVLRPHNVFLVRLFALIHLLQQAGKYYLIQIVRRAGWMILDAGGFAPHHLWMNAS